MSLNCGYSHPMLGRLLPLAAAAALLPALLAAGCGRSDDASPLPQTLDDSNVIATVNGVPINRDQMYGEMEQYVPEQQQGYPNNPLLGYPTGRVALQHLITNELLVQLAKADQVPVTTDEVAARYNDVKMVKEAQSTKPFEDLLADQGLTQQQFDYGTVAPDVAQFNLVSKGVSVSSQELQSYYSTHINDFTEPDRIHIERIVLQDQPTAESAYATVSKTNSLDTAMSENIALPLPGGDDAADIVQWINIDAPPAALKVIATQASKAQIGSILKPELVAGQWWLVKLVDRKPKEVLPFQTVDHIVAWNVATGKASATGNFQRVQAQMQDMTQQAIISVKPLQYVSLVKQLKNPPIAAPMGKAVPPGS